MIRIDLGLSGESPQPHTITWPDLGLATPWPQVIQALAPDTYPSDIQVTVLRQFNLLGSRRNLIISAPTNSGKSLLGYLALFEAVLAGRRALLLEPLRAIAQEKFDEFTRALPALSEALGRKLGIAITTGDYRLEHELMQSPPPVGGEIVIATPERIEAILRNPDFDPWINSFGAVVADEAHLLSSPRRGPALEMVLTQFLTTAKPPRLVLLSATIGDTAAALRWLTPCDLALSLIRRPPLARTILQLEGEETADAALADLASNILAEPKNSLLVFTYRTASTSQLADLLSQKLGAACGSAGARAYHARMPRAQREDARAAYLAGRSRCLVSTTALAAGVNLPATHLIIRDLTFHGVGPIPLDQLIQMAGRAGRGDNPGHAFLIHRPGDAWNLDDLAEGLRSQRMPDLISALLPRRVPKSRARSTENDETTVEATAGFVLSLLARPRDVGLTSDQLRQFTSRSLAGPEILPHLDVAIRWLSDPSRLLAHRTEEGKLIATSLGAAASRSSLPLPLACSIGQLIRDLLSLGADESILGAWSGLDHLLLLELLAERSWSLRSFSSELAEKVDAWMEKSGDKSILFNQWIRGAKGYSQASELFGSLGIAPDEKPSDPDDWCRRRAYLAVFRAIILWQRSGGETADNLARNWNLTDLAGVEEAWRDNRLWLLGSLAEMFETRCFYFHLRSECAADDVRVMRVKRHLQRLRLLALQVAARVKHCSLLGPLLVQMRQGSKGRAGVGQKTIEKLEALGLQNLAQIARLTPADFKSVGIAPSIAKRLQSYLRRRLA